MGKEAFVLFECACVQHATYPFPDIHFSSWETQYINTLTEQFRQRNSGNGVSERTKKPDNDDILWGALSRPGKSEVLVQGDFVFVYLCIVVLASDLETGFIVACFSYLGSWIRDRSRYISLSLLLPLVTASSWICTLVVKWIAGILSLSIKLNFPFKFRAERWRGQLTIEWNTYVCMCVVYSSVFPHGTSFCSIDFRPTTRLVILAIHWKAHTKIAAVTILITRTYSYVCVYTLMRIYTNYIHVRSWGGREEGWPCSKEYVFFFFSFFHSLAS